MRGGWCQPISGRNSITDHKKKTSDIPKNISSSPFNDQLEDFREPPPPFSGQNSLTDHKKKTSDVPLLRSFSPKGPMTFKISEMRLCLSLIT